MYTILGAGGGIGTALAYELINNGKKVRLVSRSGFSLPGAETLKADISDYSQMLNAVNGSEIVFQCAGLKYDIRVWSELWPKIMDNTINACKKHNAKLIFVDNVYMYGKVEGPMTESASYNPVSAKGEIRASIASKLESEYKKGNVKAIIARAADIYGPYAEKTSFVNIMVIDKMIKGSKPQLLMNADLPHSLTYTIDSGKGLYLLSQSAEAFNQIWHLPTYNPAPTGKEFVRLASEVLEMPVKYSVLSRSILKMVGLFNRNVKEAVEMLYQNEYKYHFDSTKFNSYFNYKPINYKEGIKETINYYKKNKS
jgi:nucleoside-diphosphate-sugar epimerase